MLDWCRSDMVFVKGSRHQIKFKVMILIRFTHIYIRFIWSRGEKAAMITHVMLL